MSAQRAPGHRGLGGVLMYCAGSTAFTRKWLVVVPGGSANQRGRGQAWTPWCELNMSFIMVMHA